MRQTARRGPMLLGVVLLVFSLVLSTLTVRAYLDSRDLDLASSIRGSLPSEGGATAGAATASPIASPQPAPTPTPEPPPDLSGVEVSARAAILLDASTGEIFYEKAADQPLPPASTVKIVTALTVVRHAGPEQVVTIQADDVVDPLLESHMGLKAGDTVTVQDLLVGLLLPSGNDAARALARYVGERLEGDPEMPPIARFVAEMNRVAADIGMEGSSFVEPSGIDVEGQVATARDLARAATALLAEPALKPIVAMSRATVRVGGVEPRLIVLTNTNELLREDGVSGVKTGTTTEAGQCLVVAYRGRGRTEIAVILGSQQRYDDARALLGLAAEGE